ncbi:lantibiotic dehydratase [Marinitenerispora sediminis]|uniref:Lantibiotic dehydratase n=1 Tax=Marinitenerispora sediminis TaxID=1931232 RepID=A0A368TDH8_9ACTN|nr:lantibiotic dehydratase [Marinitenerispora sediminis]RCV53985.1 lantibiotic dehydratase [Marinitenerispora sediminis]RCV60464.1 lantibiotic dehydratase [Marinitenerispora sediminis]RCV61856.1 lantibiotic dehydratase [Marinitenerispora sediminis]
MTREWRLTGDFVVRHAGMPFDWLDGLGAGTRALAAADRVVECEEALLALPGARRAAVREAVLAGRPEQVGARGDDAWRAALGRWREALEAHRAEFARAEEAATDALRAVLARTEVREAVFLSNPDAYRNMLEPFLRHRGPLNARWRRVRRQLYTYVQRFCAKNETTSFFGPMAYAAPVPGRGLRVRDTRRHRAAVFLSGWALREVRRAVVRDRRILPDLPFTLTGAPAPPGDPADAIVRELAKGPRRLTELRDALDRPLREVAAATRDLLASGAVDARIGADPYDEHPLDALAAQLGELPPSPARADWLGRIFRLEALRARVEAAPFEERLVLVPELERAFTEITGAPARRAAGRTYADRAVFFEECGSRFALEVGTRTLAEWARAATPALEACAAHGHAAQRAAARRVAAAWRAAPSRSLAAYAEETAAAFAAGGSVFHADHAPRYLAADAAAEIDRLRRVAADQPGDRYAVIDLCLAAAAPEDAAAAPPVLARTHHHLQIDGWLATMHPDRARFGADAARWIADQDGTVVGFDFGRRNKGYYRFPGRRAALRPLTWHDAEDPDVLPPGDLTVERAGDDVRLLDPAGRRVTAYLPLSDFVKYPPYAALSHPQVGHPVFDGPGDRPRVHAGGVVLQRARWSVDPGEAAAPQTHQRFLALRRLARRSGRRFVFVRTDRERKPYLVDLAAPAAADLAAHICDGAAEVVAEEMLPGPEHLWLRDDEGRRYTCEFRIQAIGRERT